MGYKEFEAKASVRKGAGVKTSACKAKGRKLQQVVRDWVLASFPQLADKDVRSTSMGASGDDVLLSEKAFSLFPYAVECKNLKAIAVYRYYEQRVPKEGHTLVVLKENNKKPLALVSLEHFMELVRGKCKCN